MFFEEYGQGVIYPFENDFQPGPNPAPGLETAETKNPGRLHAPFPALRIWWQNRAAGAIPAIQRITGATVPIPMKELPPAPVFVPGQVVYAPPPYQFQPGWRQAFVPEVGMRQSLHAKTPLLQLSRPLASKSGNKAAAVGEPKRKAYKWRAPKAR